MTSPQLDLWQAEVDALPWGGRTPRELAKEIVSEKLSIRTRGTCGVDNSVVRCPSREALRIATNPAQLMLCIGTSFK